MPGPAANQLSRLHRAELAAVAAVVEQQVRQLALTVDVRDVDGWWRRVAEELLTLVAALFAASRATGTRYLRRHGALEGATVDPVQALWSTQRAATSLRVSGPVEFKRHIGGGGDTAGAERAMATTLAGSAQRLALAGERDTVADTIASSDEIVGWRRVTDADPCAWCAMLASRGAVYRTAGSAGGVVGRGGGVRGARALGQSFHDHDQCTVEPLYERESEPADVVELEELWRQVTAGHSGKAAIREWRRWWDENRATGPAPPPSAPEPEPPPAPPAPPVAPRTLSHGEAVELMERMVTDDPWTREQLVAMGDYSGANYLDVNGLLRGTDPVEVFEPDHLAELRQQIADTADALRPLPEPLVAWRRADGPAFGVEQLDELDGLVGSVLQDLGFMSTTVAPDEVDDFDAFGEVLMEITVPAGTPAAYLEPVTKTPGEFELLLAAGRRYRILSVSRDGDDVRMRVEVLPE